MFLDEPRQECGVSMTWARNPLEMELARYGEKGRIRLLCSANGTLITINAGIWGEDRSTASGLGVISIQTAQNLLMELLRLQEEGVLE